MSNEFVLTAGHPAWFIDLHEDLLPTCYAVESADDEPYVEWTPEPIPDLLDLISGTQHFQAAIAGDLNLFASARQYMGEQIAGDADLAYGYEANIAMLLHDHYGITDYDTRNAAAVDIIKLVFMDGR
jgi:hypothetical protein